MCVCVCACVCRVCVRGPWACVRCVCSPAHAANMHVHVCVPCVCVRVCVPRNTRQKTRARTVEHRADERLCVLVHVVLARARPKHAVKAVHGAAAAGDRAVQRELAVEADLRARCVAGEWLV